MKSLYTEQDPVFIGDERSKENYVGLDTSKCMCVINIMRVSQDYDKLERITSPNKSTINDLKKHFNANICNPFHKSNWKTSFIISPKAYK